MDGGFSVCLVARNDKYDRSGTETWGGFGSTEYAETPSGSPGSNGTHDTNADVVTTSHPPLPPSLPFLCVKLVANPWETLGHLRPPHLNAPLILSCRHSNQAVVLVIEPHLFSTFIFENNIMQRHWPFFVDTIKHRK